MIVISLFADISLAMDLKIFNLTDFESRFRLAQIEAAKVPTADPRVVDIAVFVGGAGTRQFRCITSAARIVTEAFAGRNEIIPVFDFLTNDKVKRTNVWGPADVTRRFLRSDIHVCTTHWHQGNTFFNDDWNIKDIRAFTEDWRYHLGVPNGVFVGTKYIYVCGFIIIYL